MPSAVSARQYVGRFAPSPTGPLHLGSLVAAMASYLDARAHRGQWLVRIEDIDTPRVVPGADRLILHQLNALGMSWDAPPVWQSQRQAEYDHAFDALRRAGRVYPCGCTRRETAAGPYPGTCRDGLPPGRAARAWRVRLDPGVEVFHDRWQGAQRQDVAAEVGDFVVRRADGLWAYQLVVVVDDGLQGVTDVVRGADLLDSTARQRLLARWLGLTPPRTLHVPLLLDAEGRKLSKQNHAPALDLSAPLTTLQHAWRILGYPPAPAADIPAFWTTATALWADKHKTT